MFFDFSEEDTTSTTEKPADENVEKQKTPEELAIEKEKELMRQRHIRPWDYGKEGVKEHVEYTQEDWVHLKRKERNEEFAPPSLYSNDKNSLYFTSKKDKTKVGKTDLGIDTSKPPPTINNPSKRKTNPYKTEEHTEYRQPKQFEPIPIRDECVDFDDEQDELIKDYFAQKEESVDSDEGERRKRGVEIAPPPTFEYYGPSDTKKSKNISNKKVPIEESISAGLQYLRQQAEKKKNSSNHMSEMFLI